MEACDTNQSTELIIDPLPYVIDEATGHFIDQSPVLPDHFHGHFIDQPPILVDHRFAVYQSPEHGVGQSHGHSTDQTTRLAISQLPGSTSNQSSGLAIDQSSGFAVSQSPRSSIDQSLLDLQNRNRIERSHELVIDQSPGLVIDSVFSLAKSNDKNESMMQKLKLVDDLRFHSNEEVYERSPIPTVKPCSVVLTNVIDDIIRCELEQQRKPVVAEDDIHIDVDHPYSTKSHSDTREHTDQSSDEDKFRPSRKRKLNSQLEDFHLYDGQDILEYEKSLTKRQRKDDILKCDIDHDLFTSVARKQILRFKNKGNRSTDIGVGMPNIFPHAVQVTINDTRMLVNWKKTIDFSQYRTSRKTYSKLTTEQKKERERLWVMTIPSAFGHLQQLLKSPTLNKRKPVPLSNDANGVRLIRQPLMSGPISHNKSVLSSSNPIMTKKPDSHDNGTDLIRQSLMSDPITYHDSAYSSRNRIMTREPDSHDDSGTSLIRQALMSGIISHGDSACSSTSPIMTKTPYSHDNSKQSPVDQIFNDIPVSFHSSTQSSNSQIETKLEVSQLLEPSPNKQTLTKIPEKIDERLLLDLQRSYLNRCYVKDFIQAHTSSNPVDVISTQNNMHVPVSSTNKQVTTIGNDGSQRTLSARAETEPKIPGSTSEVCKARDNQLPMVQNGNTITPVHTDDNENRKQTQVSSDIGNQTSLENSRVKQGLREKILGDLETRFQGLLNSNDDTIKSLSSKCLDCVDKLKTTAYKLKLIPSASTDSSEKLTHTLTDSLDKLSHISTDSSNKLTPTLNDSKDKLTLTSTDVEDWCTSSLSTDFQDKMKHDSSTNSVNILESTPSDSYLGKFKQSLSIKSFKSTPSFKGADKFKPYSLRRCVRKISTNGVDKFTTTSANCTNTLTTASLVNCTNILTTASLFNCTNTLTTASLVNCTNTLTTASSANCTNTLTTASSANCAIKSTTTSSVGYAVKFTTASSTNCEVTFTTASSASCEVKFTTASSANCVDKLTLTTYVNKFTPISTTNCLDKLTPISAANCVDKLTTTPSVIYTDILPTPSPIYVDKCTQSKPSTDKFIASSANYANKFTTISSTKYANKCTTTSSAKCADKYTSTTLVVCADKFNYSSTNCANKSTNTSSTKCANRFVTTSSDKCANKFATASSDKCANRFVTTSSAKCADRCSNTPSDKCPDRFATTSSDKCANKFATTSSAKCLNEFATTSSHQCAGSFATTPSVNFVVTFKPALSDDRLGFTSTAGGIDKLKSVSTVCRDKLKTSETTCSSKPKLTPLLQYLEHKRREYSTQTILHDADDQLNTLHSVLKPTGQLHCKSQIGEVNNSTRKEGRNVVNTSDVISVKLTKNRDIIIVPDFVSSSESMVSRDLSSSAQQMPGSTCSNSIKEEDGHSNLSEKPQQFHTQYLNEKSNIKDISSVVKETYTCNSSKRSELSSVLPRLDVLNSSSHVGNVTCTVSSIGNVDSNSSKLSTNEDSFSESVIYSAAKKLGKMENADKCIVFVDDRLVFIPTRLGKIVPKAFTIDLSAAESENVSRPGNHGNHQVGVSSAFPVRGVHNTIDPVLIPLTRDTLQIPLSSISGHTTVARVPSGDNVTWSNAQQPISTVTGFNVGKEKQTLPHGNNKDTLSVSKEASIPTTLSTGNDFQMGTIKPTTIARLEDEGVTHTPSVQTRVKTDVLESNTFGTVSDVPITKVIHDKVFESADSVVHRVGSQVAVNSNKTVHNETSHQVLSPSVTCTNQNPKHSSGNFKVTSASVQDTNILKTMLLAPEFKNRPHTSILPYTIIPASKMTEPDNIDGKCVVKSEFDITVNNTQCLNGSETESADNYEEHTNNTQSSTKLNGSETESAVEDEDHAKILCNTKLEAEEKIKRLQDIVIRQQLQIELMKEMFVQRIHDTDTDTK